MQTVSPSRFLKHALIADAIVSGGVAVLQLAAAPVLSPMLSLPRVTLVDTGVFLVAYTALLMVLATRSRVRIWLISAVVVGNVLWAIGCGGLLLTGTLSPNALGVAYVLLQVIAVLGFAGWEYAGLMRSLDGSVVPGARLTSTATPASR
jgi:hypothetical protein